MDPNSPQRPNGPYKLLLAFGVGAATLLALMGGLAVGLFRHFQQDSPPPYSALWFWLLLAVMALFLLFVGAVAYHTFHLLRQSLGTQAMLEASEERFHQFFDLAPIGIALTSPDGRFQRANAAFCALVGYSEEELRNRTFFDMAQSDDVEKSRLWLEQLLRGQIQAYQFEKRYLHKDGHAIPVLIHASLVRDDQSRPSHIIAQALDVTERMRSEESLRQQNEYLAALHEMALAIINRLELMPLLESIVTRAASLIGTTHSYVDLELPDGSAIEQRVGSGIFGSTVGKRLMSGEGVGGKVWQSGQAMTIDDYLAWPERVQSFLSEPFHALVGVPLRSGGRTVGVLGLAYTEPNRKFSREQIELLSRFAELASLALDNARLYSAAQTELVERKRAGELRTALYRIVQAADDSENLDELFRLVHDIIKTIMPADNFYIALYDEQTDLMSFPYFVDEVDTPVPPRKPDHWLSDYVLRTGRPLLATPEKQNELERTGEAVAGGVPSEVWLGVPLIVEKKPIGLMTVQHYSDPGAYTENDLRVLEFVSSEVARAIERLRAAEALRQSEQRFRILAENAPGVIYQCRNDEPYTMVYLNDMIEALTGYPKEDYLESRISLQDLGDPVDNIADRAIVDAAIAVRQPFHLVYRIKHKSGEWRWIEEWGTGVYDENGALLLLEGFLSDITERKLAEAQLERNARELAALDHMGKAVAASLDFSVVLKTVIDEVSPLIRPEGMSVLLPEGDNKLVFAAASGPASAGLVGHRIPMMASVAGGVMRTGRSVLVASGDGEPQLYREVEQISHYQTRSLLAVPLSLGGEVIGVMEAVHTQPDAFTQEDQRLLEATATWAAIAIGNARQHERIQRRLQESEAMAAISRALNETLDLPVILQLIVDSARRVIPVAERAVMHLYDEASSLLRPVAASGRPLGIHDLVLHPGEGISGYVFAEGALLNVGNTALEPSFVHMRDGGPDPASLLSVPVQSGTRRLGTLNVDSQGLNAFSTDDEHLLNNLGVQAALAIENARLFESARRRADELNAASDILRSLNAASNIAEAFPVIAEGLKALTRCDRVSLAIFDDKHEWASVMAIDQRQPELGLGARMPIEHSALAQGVLAGRTYYTPDLALEVDVGAEKVFYDTGYRSTIVQPLRVGERTIGSLNMSWLTANGYSPSQLPLLEQIADAIALAVEKNRLHVETTEALSREQRLNEVSRAISGALDLSSTLDAITRLAAELIGAEAASLALVSDDRQYISSAHFFNFPNFFTNIPTPRGQGVVWAIMDARRPLQLEDYASHPRAMDEWVAAGARAFVGVPLLAGQECLGVLGLFQFDPAKTFTARDVALAESVGRQAGVALQNARLFEALSQEKRRIELLYTLSQGLTTTLDSREVASRAIQLTTGALGVDVGEVFQAEPGSDRLTLVATSGYNGETVEELNCRVDVRVGRGLSGQVALAKKPILAPNVGENPYWLHIPDLDDGIESAASLPLLVGDELIGVFTLLSKERSFFKEEQLPTLTAVATSLALAFQNAQLFEAARQRVEALTALHETALELSTPLDLPVLLRSIVERAARLLDAPIGGLSLLLPDGQTLELVVNYNSPADYTCTRIRVGEGAAGMAVKTGQPLIVNDYSQWEHRAETYKDAPFRSVVAIPIKWRGQIMGVITANDVRPNAFVAADTELISLFADQAAVAIANARQHQELQRRLQESDAIASISRALNETLDLQKLLLLIVDSARRIIPNVERAVIHLLDQDGQTLRPAAVSGEGESGQSLIMRTGEGVAGQVIAKGIVINVSDTHTDPRYLAPERASPTRSLLVAPVQSGAHRLGTLSVNTTTPYAFSPDDEGLLGTLGTQAALAIYNAQLFEDTRRQLDELLLLHTMAIAGAEATSEDELLERSTRLMFETFYPVNFGVMLLDESGRFLRAHKSYVSGPPGYRIPVGQGVTGRVAATGKSMLVPDVRMEPSYVNADPKTRSELCVPLKTGNLILGVMNAESEMLNAFSETDLRLLSTLAGQAATAIQKLRLYRDLEQALKQEKATRAQLVQSEKLAAMGRLVASVAHELNNPLQAIQNALYLVRQEPTLGRQAIDDLRAASTEADRMADLINRLRETYRPTTSEEFHFESINGIVTDVQKLVATHLRHNNIEFRFEADPDLPYVPGIRDQLKQVMLNLCVNAVEAMPSGGRLTIRTRYDPVLSSVQLTVQDTGVGVPEDILPSIFDPFFTTKENGTGLGLTITYDIIQRHKGRIEVESAPGGGAAFHIWLPVELKSKSR